MAAYAVPPQNHNIVTAKFYRPLLPWQTRLIELLPDPPGSPLCCNVHLADVVAEDGFGLPEASPPRRQTYEALSYSWGRPDLTAEILCNSELVLVPPAMAEALNALRYADRSHWLWCDAISINQQDAMEKSYQVQMMQTIFRKASRVVAWLGAEDEYSIRAFHVIAARSERLSLVQQEESGNREEREGASGLQQLDGSFDAHGFTAGVQRERFDLKAVEALCERPWFRRVWIRQEVFAATELVLQAGPRMTSFYDLQTFLAAHMDSITGRHRLSVLIDHFRARYEPVTASELSQKLDQFYDSNPYNFKGYVEFEEYHGIRVMLTQPDKKHRAAIFCDYFMKTVIEGKDFGVSDNRDRIYALLGIINESPTRSYLDEERQIQRLTPLPIDYGKSLSMVYQDVVKYLINTSGALHCLEVRRHYHVTTRTPPFARMENLPSWATDWQIDEELKVEKDERIFERARSQDLSRVGELILDGRLLGTLIDGEPSEGTPAEDLHKAREFLGRPYRHEPDNIGVRSSPLQDSCGFMGTGWCVGSCLLSSRRLAGHLPRKQLCVCPETGLPITKVLFAGRMWHVDRRKVSKPCSCN